MEFTSKAHASVAWVLLPVFRIEVPPGVRTVRSESWLSCLLAGD